MSHLTGILDKANAAKIRADRTIEVVNRIENTMLTPVQERDLEPYLDTLNNSPVPSEVEYATIDEALDGIDGVLG